MLLTQYKSRFTGSQTVAESLRIINVGETVSVTTSLEGTIFAKVKSIDSTSLTFQILKHNFEPTNKTVKILSTNIVSIKHIFVKQGIGAVLK